MKLLSLLSDCSVLHKLLIIPYYSQLKKYYSLVENQYKWLSSMNDIHQIKWMTSKNKAI